MSNAGFFMSAMDKDIYKEIQRDPLGFQPLWSSFGSRLIPHLTTRTYDVNCMNITLANLYIAERFIEKLGGRYVFRNVSSFNGFILVFEQLMVYSLLKGNVDHSLPGKQKGSTIYHREPDGNPMVSPYRPILTNHISQGIYGSYKSSLASMKVMRNNGKLGDLGVTVQSIIPGLTDLESSLDKFYSSLIKNSSNNVPFNDFEGVKAMCGLVGLSVPARDFWRDRLGLAGDTIQSRVYRKLESFGSNPPQGVKSIVATLDDATEAKKVFILEEYLCMVDRVFDAMFLGEDRAIKEVSRLIHDQGMQDKYESFCSLKTYDAAHQKRLKALQDIEPAADLRFIKGVLRYHAEVCAERGRGKWLEYDETTKVITKLNLTYSPDINGEIHWNRSYYVDSLNGIKVSLGGK